MRLETFDLPDRIVLKFETDSVSILKADVKKLGLKETVQSLIGKLTKMAKLDGPEYIELDGDEDDEDISLYEEVVESPYMYLKEKGVI
jgi:hypothetical protein